MTPMHVTVLLGCLFSTSALADTTSTFTLPSAVDVTIVESVYVKSITISYQGAAYALDVTDMYNAWSDRPLQYPGGVPYFSGKCFDKKNCQFRGPFSDAAGAFVAEWQILDAVAIRTVLTFSDAVAHLFVKNIDPPEYD